ncbi:unnamed protein product [marine sediment metagenome]|uniref:Uncharacterized protein n=2 Tax=marine sediment metagenome TaxID=412755 RepID=X1RBK8_9ZZZZ
MTLIRDINNILEYGRKTMSYKYATLLAIFDFITEHPSELPINNLHFILIDYLARQFISYYYPFSFHNFYQGFLVVYIWEAGANEWTRENNTGNNPQVIPGYPIIFTGMVMFSIIFPLIKKRQKS